MSDDEQMIDVLYVAPDRFTCRPQVGTPSLMSRDMLVDYLARPTIGESKECAGAWSAALYRDNVRRKDELIRVWALVLDVDKDGDIDRVADALSAYRGCVHSTFSSTDTDPHCRAVVFLDEPIDAPTYDAVHTIARAHLRSVGILADEGAKDASRLSYSPVVRAGVAFDHRRLAGTLLDAKAVIAANPPEPPKRPERAERPISQTDNRYLAGALRRAFDAVASAPEGERNKILNREAYAIARLDLKDAEIEGALLAAALNAGLSKREAERTIASALRARRSA